MSNFGPFNDLNLNHVLHESTHLDLGPSNRQDSLYFETHQFSHLISSRNGLTVASLNVQSLRAKLSQIEILNNILIQDSKPIDVICLQETWLGSGADASLLQLDGYRLVLHGDANSNHRGVAIYIKSSLPYTIRPESTINSLWEALFIEISYPEINKPIIVGSVYRPPRHLIADKTSFVNEFNDVISSIQSQNKYILVAGDFNLNFLKVNSDNSAALFYNTITSTGFEPLITLPTRFTDHTCTLIDNIFCNLLHPLQPISGILTTQLSDHQMCFTLLPTNNNNHKDTRTKYVKVTHRPNNYYDLIRSDFADLNILNNMQQDLHSDPTYNCELLTNALDTLINKHTSTKTVKLRKHKHKKSEWITPGIIKSIKFRDKMYLKKKRSPQNSPEFHALKTNLSTYNKILKKAIHNAKNNYHANLFKQHQNNPKETWKHLNTLLNRKYHDTPIEKIIVDGRSIDTPTEICNSFNDFFSEIGHSTAASIPNTDTDFQTYLKPATLPTFNFHLIDNVEIDKIISSLKSKHSTGQDNISTILIKSLKPELIAPITLIVNQMLTTSIFPNSLKIAKVKPLYKKGDANSRDNYRPISLLPSISKILEKIILIQLDEHFTHNNIYFSSQYGFQKKKSTEHALLELTDRILHQMDMNNSPLTIFLDLSKAFDTLNHEILIAKLKHYGLNNSALQLCKNYLTSRKQYTQIQDAQSSQIGINIGVPQGSILGPFLFLVFVNDLPNCSDSFNFITYADDTTLISTINHQFVDDTNSLNTELNNVYKWLCTNKLSLNISKTKSLIFHTPHRQITPPVITINNTHVENVDTFNFLGITLDKHMTWKPHTNKVLKKIAQITGALNNLKHMIPLSAKMHIYNALIVPHLNYGVLAWGFSPHTNSILKIQKKALRAIINTKYNAHTDPIFKELGLLNVQDSRQLFEVKFFHKLKANLLPHYFANFVSTNESLHTNAPMTRGRRLLSVPAHRHHFFKLGLRYSIVNTINSCPVSILNKCETHSIKSVSERFKTMKIESYEVECTC